MTTKDRYPMTPSDNGAPNRQSHRSKNGEKALRSNCALLDEQERQRKARAERSKAKAKGGTGDFTFEQVIRQRELLAKVAAKRETTDNIGRAA